ncbi:MAG: hypothetical protein V1844_05020 [Pseudomonadota bacterium]
MRSIPVQDALGMLLCHDITSISLPVGIVTTGSEIFQGRITDKFGPVLRDKSSAGT